MANSFAAHFSPRQFIPNSVTHRNIFRWYQRLLQYSPVTIFLKQKNRLLSESSTSQINFPYRNLKYQIKALSSKHGSKRSYHLTELIYYDTLSLAIRSRERGYTETKPRIKDWPSINIEHDELCNKLSSSKDIEILHKGTRFEGPESDIFEQFPVKETIGELEQTSIADVFPYDVSFNDLYILTIEAPVLGDSHEELMRILRASESEFQIFAVRLDLTQQLLLSSFKSSMKPSVQKNVDYKYDDLLEIAKNAKLHSNIDDLIQFFAEQGSTRVALNKAQDSLYLLEK
ncbi:hypothetical protein CANTEDRAFT_96125 [Yamadazyma tenuis ATCC 10573]|nr:uncharacterized protein CANTEDRAFT_96125 [Yamadazyma tenuis ATCC 10573]EGV60681.1 hypothetical protein CANTEDRAFT_96125 [Yamadazyma tenuis ATCC 10573]